MLKLLTTDIWNQVAEKANGCEMRVAVAFVTDLGRLKMKRGGCSYLRRFRSEHHRRRCR